MLEYNDDILAILRLQMSDQVLEGYYGGVLSQDGTKLIAYTWLPIDRGDHNDHRYNHLVKFCGGCYSSAGTGEDELRIYYDEGSYSMKGLEKCLEEKIFHSYSLEFTGAMHEGNWYIGCDLIFFGSQMDEVAAKRFNATPVTDPDIFQKGLFAPYRTRAINGREVRNVEYEVYPDLPWIVSMTIIEQIAKVHQAFTTYMNLAFVKPFFERLRVRYPDEYVKFSYRYSEDYTLLFPGHRRYFLVVAEAENERLGHRLAWFFFDIATETFYRWKYPQARYGGPHDYTPDIIDDIKEISSWDDAQFLGSTRTLDDNHFWQEYVLKKEDGAYIWLEPMAVGGGKLLNGN